VNVDVTDRRRTERRLAAIIDGALDAIVLLDAAGLITDFNPAAEQTFGYAQGEAIGRELAELVIDPALREAHRRGIARYLATGEGVMVGRRTEMRAMHASGALFDAELTVIRLPPAARRSSPASCVTSPTASAPSSSARASRVSRALHRHPRHDLRTPLARSPSRPTPCSGSKGSATPRPAPSGAS